MPKTVEQLLEYTGMEQMDTFTAATRTQFMFDGIRYDAFNGDKPFEVRELAAQYSHPSIRAIWARLNSGPDVVLSKMLSKVDACVGTGLLRRIKDHDPERDALCKTMVTFFSRYVRIVGSASATG